jgi:signal transduction histidine kinase
VETEAAPRRGRETFEEPLWRALAVFRLAALAYAALLVGANFRQYAHPAAGWVVIAVMAGWTGVTIYAYGRPEWPRAPLLGADMAVGLACLLVSPWVLGDGQRRGVITIPVAWIAGPVVAWAIAGGRRLGVAAGVAMGIADMVVRGHGFRDQVALSGAVLLVLAGVAVGHVARLAVEAQERLQRAAELEAATRERDRLARGIHDSVLQVLALVQRRGAKLGGEAAELGRLAGEQEAALRSLIGSEVRPAGSLDSNSEVDLRALLAPYTSVASVSLATPAVNVLLPAGEAQEVAAAVGAALANVRQHCGPDTRAWVLLEDEGDLVTVSVRDEGPGIPPGRLEQAAAEGRLGVAQAIQGRIRDLGGIVAITSAPGTGTEVEFRVPRARPS